MLRSHVLSSVPVVLLLASIAPVGGCKLLDRKGDKDDTKVEGPGPESPNEPPSKKASPSKDSVGTAAAGCELPKDGTISADFTISKGCVVTSKNHVRVRENATLTIEAGAKLLMDSGRYISVDKGKLVARGTEAEPVVFTSSASTQAPGDWVGIMFEDDIGAGTVLDHVKIEYAGASQAGGKGAIWFVQQRSGGRVSVTSSEITNSDQAAVWSDSEKGGFAKFENNKMSKNKWSVKVPANVLGTIGAGNVFGDPLATWGDVEESTTWPAVDAPIFVERNIVVGGQSSAPVLTIPPKTVLKFAGGRYLSVGDRNGGNLVAREVTFTSANTAPQPGDWAGVFLASHATNVDLSGSTIEYAGRGAGSKGGITLRAPAKSLPGLKATGITYKQNVGAGVSTQDGDCAPFESGSKSEGAPLCKKN